MVEAKKNDEAPKTEAKETPAKAESATPKTLFGGLESSNNPLLSQVVKEKK